MEEATKVAETPATSEVSGSESIIESKRTAIEALVMAENANVPEETVEVPTEVKAPEDATTEPQDASDDPVERIKKSVQKRINKVVAEKKSAEEELAEARAEIERLKAKTPEAPKEPENPSDDKAVTPEQVEAYIAKMSEEGNHKEVAAATRYLIKLEKELALKEIEERNQKATQEEQAKKDKQLKEWVSLSQDYVEYDETGKPDPKGELNLSNQKGLLYQTALGLYNDKELHRDFYFDENPIVGFRRAVADAYREIHQQGLIKKSPKGLELPEPKRPRQVLVDPSSESGEETVQSTASSSLSDAEKVREEIKARNKNRFKR